MHIVIRLFLKTIHLHFSKLSLLAKKISCWGILTNSQPVSPRPWKLLNAKSTGRLHIWNSIMRTVQNIFLATCSYHAVIIYLSSVHKCIPLISPRKMTWAVKSVHTCVSLFFTCFTQMRKSERIEFKYLPRGTAKASLQAVWIIVMFRSRSGSSSSKQMLSIGATLS